MFLAVHSAVPAGVAEPQVCQRDEHLVEVALDRLPAGVARQSACLSAPSVWDASDAVHPGVEAGEGSASVAGDAEKSAGRESGVQALVSRPALLPGARLNLIAMAAVLRRAAVRGRQDVVPFAA